MNDVIDLLRCGECSLDGEKVYGSGCRNNPLIVFIGEAPGYHEVNEGRPFVGMAGKVIRSVVQQVGIPEDRVYYTNLCLCRPPENRDPSAAEIKCCWDRLEHEIRIANPKILVALGAIPGRVILPGKTLSNHRGRIEESELGFPCMLTYHPAATLYPKGATLFPFIYKDIEKVWRFLRGKTISKKYSDPITKVVTVTSEELMESLLRRLNQLPPKTMISFDWETTGTKPSRDIGFCLGLSWSTGTAAVIPDKFTRLYSRELGEALAKHTLTGYNVTMFDSKFNKKLGLPSYITDDAMLMHYALDERPQKRSLENTTIDELDAPAYEAEMIAEYDCSKDEMLEKIPEEVVYEYCGKDADWSLRLSKVLLKRLHEEPTLHTMYRSVLIPAANAFAEIQENGVWVDRDRLQEVSLHYCNESDYYESELRRVTGIEDFNPRSPKQVQEYLWDTLQLPQPRIYGRKDRSADASTIGSLIESGLGGEFPQLLSNYKTAHTMYSRYLKRMDEYIDADGRVRAQYHLDRTETGRLSTTNPAIHQTPRESMVRTIYGAPPGFKLIQADYSQVEMRMAAHCAGDTQLASMFHELEEVGSDFHTYMASKAFGVPLDAVTKDQRQAAKVVSFGILYRMSPKGLAARIGLNIGEATKIINDYEGLMPGVSRWIKRTESQVRGQGYVETIFGRRRRFPFITNDNLAELLREAVNTPIQSASSDLTLHNVVKLHEIFKRYYPEVKIVIMVHDEIDIECPTPLVPQIARIVKRTMETPPFDTDVPFPVEVVVGTHWGEGEIYGG